MCPSDDTAREAVLAAKQAVREHARAARSALDLEVCLDAAQALAANLIAMPELATARVVCGYRATTEEIDPAAVLAMLQARGVTIAYPRIEAPGMLGLHIADDDAVLLPGPFGLTEPPPDAPRVPFDAIDAVIVPGVAFDEGCWRLGYGGGYYDRLLPLLPHGCARIGVAYDEQVLAAIPAEAHDVRLHAVVTPTRVIRAR